SAYDIARQKREAEIVARQELEKDLNMVGPGIVQEVDGVRLEPIGDNMMWVLHERLASDVRVAPYALAVARMGMRANAQALAGDHPGWRAVRGGDRYYVIAGEADTLEGILAKRADFEREHADFKPLNLPGITILFTGR
ncbi:MAG: hypothetical protein K2H86_06700, partial [Muribaculaceae bacterium]|nr:hypothetical protein [Muribaculaceae bacterium]